MTIGFIGLGNLGEPLAMSLVRAGREVRVHDLRADSAQRLVAAGAIWADSIAAACDGADTAITALPSPAASRAAVEGPDGVLARLSPGACWIEASTTDIGDLKRLAEVAGARGIDVLECPVSGGVHRAHAGEITVLVGGDRAVFERMRPLLEVIGGEIHYLGPIGNAGIVKVITNMLAFIHLVAAGEGLMLAARAGIDLGAAFRAIRASSGNSFVHETESQVILNGSYDIGFTLGLANKDLGLVRDIAEELGVPLALGGLTGEIFQAASERFGADAFSPKVVALLEEACGQTLRAPGFPPRLDPA